MSKKNEEKELVVVLMGDLSDGYTPVGPFETPDAAFEWLDKNNKDHWPLGWVMPLVPQKDYADHMAEHEEDDSEGTPESSTNSN